MYLLKVGPKKYVLKQRRTQSQVMRKPKTTAVDLPSNQRVDMIVDTESGSPTETEELATIDSVLSHVPALDSIISRLNTSDLKRLSEANKDWWYGTQDEIVKRCAFVMGDYRESRRPYTTAKSVRKHNGFKKAADLPTDLPLTHFEWECGHVDSQLLKTYPGLKSLVLKNCTIAPGSYDGVQHLAIDVEYKELDFLFNLDKVIFKDLKSFSLSVDPENKHYVHRNPSPKLCSFIVNHPELQSLALEMRQIDHAVFELLAEHFELEQLELLSHDYDWPLRLTSADISCINKIPSLGYLKFMAGCYDVFKIDISKLHTFKLGDGFGADQQSVAQWIPFSTKMKSLSLTNIWHTPDSPLFPIGLLSEKFPNLEELELNSKRPNHWKQVDDVTFPHLKSLVLVNVNGLSRIKAPLCEKFKLYYGWIDEGEVDDLARSFPKLNSFVYKNVVGGEIAPHIVRAFKHCRFFQFKHDYHHWFNDKLESSLNRYFYLDKLRVAVIDTGDSRPFGCKRVVRLPSRDYCLL